MENKKRLIDVNYALQQIEIGENENSGQFKTDSSHIKDFLNVLPTVDAVEVVYGRWIVKGQEVFCSHCDKESGYNHWGASAFSDYCPNCGAKMDGK